MRDTAIQNGDFLKNSGGLPVTITGKDALLQEAYLRLQIHRGSFLYDPTLGSRLFEQDRTTLTEEDAMLLIEEAFAGSKDLRAVRMEVHDGLVSVTVATPFGNGIVTV